jgi:transcription termination/antitermination protein NusA
MASEIQQAIQQICDEKGLSYDSVMETVETALAAAYRKDYGNKMQNIEVEFDVEGGGIKAYDVKTVVEDLPEEEIEAMRRAQAEEAAAREAAEADPFSKPPKREREDHESRNGKTLPGEEGEEEKAKFNPKTEVMHSDAKVLKMSVEIGEVMRTELPVATEFGRMAAMTAKQVITQKLREAEREIVFNEYKEQEGEILIGTVQRREGRVILVDIGRSVGVLLPEDQAPNERYNSGDRIKVYVREVTLGSRGPQILLSRTSTELVRTLFEVEIPEIGDGIVIIKDIARDAGHRTKISVHTDDGGIDPIGACIGQRGIRIQTIITELGGEKIDVIEWSEDQENYLLNALSPAKIGEIQLNEETKEATAFVANDQLSLAIGKGGQNVRLAARLTGWQLRIQEEVADDKDSEEKEEEVKDVEKVEEVKEVTDGVEEDPSVLTEEAKEEESEK